VPGAKRAQGITMDSAPYVFEDIADRRAVLNIALTAPASIQRVLPVILRLKSLFELRPYFRSCRTYRVIWPALPAPVPQELASPPSQTSFRKQRPKIVVTRSFGAQVCDGPGDSSAREAGRKLLD